MAPTLLIILHGKKPKSHWPLKLRCSEGQEGSSPDFDFSRTAAFSKYLQSTAPLTQIMYAHIMRIGGFFV